MPDDEEGWSIHVPTTGFTTTEVEHDGDAEGAAPDTDLLRVPRSANAGTGPDA